MGRRNIDSDFDKIMCYDFHLLYHFIINPSSVHHIRSLESIKEPGVMPVIEQSTDFSIFINIQFSGMSHLFSRGSDKHHHSAQSQESFHTFTIHYNHKSIQLSLPSRSTVRQLTDLAKAKIQPYLRDRLVCLQSTKKNQMVDYALLLPQQKLYQFKKSQEFKVYTCSQPHQKGKKYTLADFSFLKCLGQGGSASVYLVRRKTSGKLYALKQIDKEYFIEFKRMEQILRQKKILSEIVKEFPFCAKLYGSFESQKHLNFLLQYYPGGELFLHLQRRKLEEHQVKLYFCEVVLTFEFLHNSRVVYRDLKPQNIMVDYEGHIRLADFGLCKLNLEQEENTYSFCGSLEYMAPEVRNNLGYSYPVDFYTIGAFLYQMLVGIPPYYNNQPLYFPQKISRPATNLIKGLIQKEPRKRISSFEVIKKSVWLDGVNWKQVFNKKYQMPIKLSLYNTYIHQQFSQFKVDSMNLIKQQKFDNLFSMFQYQNKLGQLSSKHKFPMEPQSKRNKSKSKSKSKSKDYKQSKDKSRKSCSSNDSKEHSKNKNINLPKKTKPKQEYFLRSLSPPLQNFGKSSHHLFRSLSPPITLSRNKYH